MTTLDRLLEEHSFEPPVGLKIDTEGLELDVIRGASRLLRDAQFVIAEASVSRRFEGGYPFADIVREMDERDFQLCDILEVSRSRETSQVVFRRREGS